MAAALAPRPTFVPDVTGDDDPVGVTTTRRDDNRAGVDPTRLVFWLAYIAVVATALSYGVSVLGAWLLDAAWIGIVPASAATLLVVASLLGRARPAVA